MASSYENIFRVTGPLCGEFTGHRWIPRTKASHAGDLRRHRAHSDIIVMKMGGIDIQKMFCYYFNDQLFAEVDEWDVAKCWDVSASDM